jgi:ribosomal protein S18 acetylase RimI-like enzyme
VVESFESHEKQCSETSRTRKPAYAFSVVIPPSTISPAHVTIRRARCGDAAKLAELAARTFHDTFASSNDSRLMAEHMARSYGPSIQMAELLDTNIRTLLAETACEALAYTQIRPQSELLRPPACVGDPEACEIWRFYVDQRWHGQGVAQRLMGAAIDEVRAEGAKTVWLGVWEHNPRAIAFYRKCGFALVGDHEFMFADERQTDLVMSRTLT